MVKLYAVRERRGGPWDWARSLREQAGFDDHARFMDELVKAGFILLGGPLEGDREVLLVVSAPSADAIRGRLAADPWLQDGTRPNEQWYHSSDRYERAAVGWLTEKQRAEPR